MNEFDEDLLKIKHFNFYPELLPFIGEYYNDYRVLLIAESHYIDLNENFGVLSFPGEGKVLTEYEDEAYRNIIKNWYDINYMEKYDYYKKFHNRNYGWYHTRNVTNAYLDGHENRYILRGPMQALVESINQIDGLTDKDLAQRIAFMNYFQRPSYTSQSLSVTLEDDKKSFEIVNQVIQILEPKIICFLSKKAYYYYTNKCNDKIKEKCKYYNHPRRPGWNSKKESEKDHIKNVFIKDVSPYIFKY